VTRKARGSNALPRMEFCNTVEGLAQHLPHVGTCIGSQVAPSSRLLATITTPLFPPKRER